MDVRRTRGRRFPEPQHPYRNDYARDRDRVIHSRAFRRLEAKTQVFTTRYSDHFRNRLTHTLEVAQIARTVAGALRSEYRSRRSARAGARYRPSALRPRRRKTPRSAHARIRRALQSQSSRALHRRTIRAALSRFPGLNLTFEVREGIIKHSRDYSAAEFPELAEYLARPAPPARIPAHRFRGRNRLQHRRPR